MKSIYYIVPLINFLIAALFGLLLRSMFVYVIDGPTFLYVLHTHSHIALLGWLYLLFYILFVRYFAIDTPVENRFFKRLFWLTQLSVIGMGVTFPFMGYAVASISFSTMHIICSYVFAFRLWKNNNVSGTQYGILLKIALFFMVFSTVGVWCLGPVVGLMGKTSDFYQICIQFFLHFQFNGWFLTAFMALLFATILKDYSLPKFKVFYCIWILSVVLTYALPLSWYMASSVLYYLNALGVLLQFYVIGYLIKIIYSRFKGQKKRLSVHLYLLLVLMGICLLIRIGMQLLTISETIVVQLQGLRSWVVGFIHLNMLGVLSSFGIWLIIIDKKMIMNNWTKGGVFLLSLGFISTEFILFIQGLQDIVGTYWLNRIPLLLLWESVLLPMSVLCFIFSYIKIKKL